MNKNLVTIFLLLIHSLFVKSELRDLYQLNLNHQQAVDQFDKQEKIPILQDKFGFKNREAENAKILDVVLLIQEGNIPANVRVLNTTYNTQKINSRILTIYDTTYVQGNDEKGSKNRVRIILDPFAEEYKTLSDWWIDSSNWKGDIRISRLTHYRLWGNGKNYKLVKRSTANSITIKGLLKKNLVI